MFRILYAEMSTDKRFMIAFVPCT